MIVHIGAGGRYVCLLIAGAALCPAPLRMSRHVTERMSLMACKNVNLEPVFVRVGEGSPAKYAVLRSNVGSGVSAVALVFMCQDSAPTPAQEGRGVGERSADTKWQCPERGTAWVVRGGRACGRHYQCAPTPAVGMLVGHAMSVGVMAAVDWTTACPHGR